MNWFGKKKKVLLTMKNLSTGSVLRGKTINCLQMFERADIQVDVIPSLQAP